MADISAQSDFLAVVDLIRRSREAAFRAVNTHLIDLYWNIGEYISQRVKNENWGRFGCCESCRVYCKDGTRSKRIFGQKPLADAAVL